LVRLYYRSRAVDGSEGDLVHLGMVIGLYVLQFGGLDVRLSGVSYLGPPLQRLSSF
jgi:hypothetical protein